MTSTDFGQGVIQEPHLPGELIPRWHSQYYPAIVRQQRPEGLEFDAKMMAAIEEMIALVNDLRRSVPEGAARLDLYDAMLHLRDASNPDLPQTAREQHYDIFGSIVWGLISGSSRRGALVGTGNETLNHALDVWRCWGGC